MINIVNEKHFKTEAKVVIKLHFSGNYIVIFNEEGRR